MFFILQLLLRRNLVCTPVHVINVFKVVGAGPDVVDASLGGIVDGVVVLLSKLSRVECR